MSKTEQQIADLAEVLGALLAASHDRIYPVHAREVLPAAMRLATSSPTALAQKYFSDVVPILRQIAPPQH